MAKDGSKWSVPHKSARTEKDREGGSNDEWRSPPALIAWLEEKNGVPFLIDAAATQENTVAPLCFTQEHSSLKSTWTKPLYARTGEILDMRVTGDMEWATRRGRLLAFMNPPYSKIAGFMKAAYEACLEGFGVDCLVPLRPGTRWYREWVHLPEDETYDEETDSFSGARASKVWQISGRLRYLDADGTPRTFQDKSGAWREASAPFDSAIIEYRPGHAGPPQVNLIRRREGW